MVVYCSVVYCSVVYFKVTKFETLASRKRENGKNALHDFYRGCYSPSTGTKVNAVICDLGLNFRLNISCNAFSISVAFYHWQICLDSHSLRCRVALVPLIFNNETKFS